VIDNPPNNAQLGDISYHSPKLHPGPCNSVSCGRGQTVRHTHRQTDTQSHVTTIHFSWSTTHAKCNNNFLQRASWSLLINLATSFLSFLYISKLASVCLIRYFFQHALRNLIFFNVALRSQPFFFVCLWPYHNGTYLVTAVCSFYVNTNRVSLTSRPQNSTCQSTFCKSFIILS